MPASKHKPITSSPEGSTPQSSTPIAPDQEEFRKSLRRLAVSAEDTAMAPTPASLQTPTGRIEDIHVPRDREGQFHTQVAGALQPL